MMPACTALLVTLTANVATVCFAGRNNFKAERTSTVTHVMDQIGALLQTRGVSSGAVLENLRTLITPGATESLNEVLTKVIGEIEANVESKIKAGHGYTQAAIKTRIDELNLATTHAVDQKKTSDELDTAWFNCVADEKAKKVAVEEAEAALAAAQKAQIAPCQLQEDRKMFSFEPNPDSLSFVCNIATHGNCDPQLQNYEAQVESMLQGLESDAAAAEKRWQEAKAACDAAKAEVVAKRSALDSAISVWKAARKDCQAKHESRQITVCIFGTTLQHKCSKVAVYNSLLKEVDTVNGGEHSHPDRIKEWKAVAVTKCMISKVVEGAEIDTATLDACESSVNYDRDVGVLDKQESQLAALTSPKKFTCEEATITFGGETWEVPQGEMPASSEYVSKADHPEVSLAADTAPFALCGGGGSSLVQSDSGSSPLRFGGGNSASGTR